MNYIIWGAGDRGARIFYHLKKDNIKAFIDMDESKVGKEYCGKRIISFEEYKKEYLDCFIIISCLHENEVKVILKNNDIHQFFLLTDCPGELQESYPRNLLKKYMQRYIKKDKKYVIYGCTLYSLILSDWIEEKTGICIDIIPHVDVDFQLVKQLKKVIRNHRFDTLEDLSSKNIDEILLTVEADSKIVQQYKNNRTIITNVYDCSDDIEEYYNPQIEKIKNIHKGERCFIIATGPSLKIEDLNTLWSNKEICIGTNFIWRAFEYTVWRPQYYIAVDYRMLRDYGDIIEGQNIGYLFLGDTYKDYWSKNHSMNHLKHHYVYEYSEERYPKFSSDFSRKSYQGFTVTYNAIQLAAYMGFQEIYLLGVDFSYAGKQDEKYTHFYKEDTLTAIGYEKQVSLAYASAKKYADEKKIKIYNATRGGKLEIFERVNFDSLFR